MTGTKFVPHNNKKHNAVLECVMASIFANTNLTYQAGVDRLIGISIYLKNAENITKQWKPPTWI
jgi:hypothetical protein